MSRFARITEDPDYDYYDDSEDWDEHPDPQDPKQLQKNNKDFFANSLENS